MGGSSSRSREEPEGGRQAARSRQNSSRRSRGTSSRPGPPRGRSPYYDGYPGAAAAGFPPPPPQGGGLYFGNAFLLPGTSIPQRSLEAMMLAQMRPDLAYMYPNFFQQMMQPAPPPPEFQRTSTIRSDINLRKDTLKAKSLPQEPSKMIVEFTFDAAVSGKVHVFYNSREMADSAGLPVYACAAVAEYEKLREQLLIPISSNFERFVPVRGASPPPIAFKKELNQAFCQPVDHAIDLAAYRTEELVYAPGGTVFPLVVCLVANTGDGEDESKHVQAQTTFCAFSQGADKLWSVKVLKQKIMVNGQAYVLQEIYGMDQSPVSGQPNDDDSGSECVVCMSEPRDTTVLPCRHMCLCHGCAEVLRHKTNKCPVCRTPVDSFLQIKVDKGKQGESSGAAAPAASVS